MTGASRPSRQKGTTGAVGVTADTPFRGMPTGTLDKKGRVCVPSRYRQILVAQDTTGIIIRKALASLSLECFSESVMAAINQSQARDDMYFRGAHDLTSFALHSLCEDLAIDETGRVRLPEEMIAYAGLKENVTFVGMGRKFEIWDSERYAPVYNERLAAVQAEAHKPAGMSS